MSATTGSTRRMVALLLLLSLASLSNAFGVLVVSSSVTVRTRIYLCSTKESTSQEGEQDVQVRLVDESIRQSMIAMPAPKAPPLIFAGTKRYQTWRLVTLVGAILTAIWVPYEVAFSPTDNSAGQILNAVLWAIFASDMFVNCNLAISPKELGEEGLTSRQDDIIPDRSEIIKTFVTSRMFWVDLVGVFPFEAVALAAGTTALGGEVGPSQQATLSILRLLSLVRLHRMAPLSDQLQNNPRISLIWFTLTRNFAVLLLVNHLSACVMYFLARSNDFDEHTWLGPVVSQMNGVERYVVALYQSVVTFSTVGYGVRPLLCPSYVSTAE
jgi:Ion transport protein